MYQELTLLLVARARVPYGREHFMDDLDGAVYALDATIIELCLKLFPWATAPHNQKTVAGVKLHTLLEVQSNLPVFARVSAGNVHEMRILDEVVFEPGAFYVMDRAYTDFARLKNIDNAGAFFVIRGNKGLRFTRVASHPVDKMWGAKVDQTIRLVIPKSLSGYPDCLRRIRYFDVKHERAFLLLTNNFVLDALTIAELYHSRWKYRAVLQMDYAAFSNQGLLWHDAQRRQHLDLDRVRGLRLGGHRQKRNQARSVALHNPTNLERDTV